MANNTILIYGHNNVVMYHAQNLNMGSHKTFLSTEVHIDTLIYSKSFKHRFEQNNLVSFFQNLESLLLQNNSSKCQESVCNLLIISSFLIGKSDPCMLGTPWKIKSLKQSAILLSILDRHPVYSSKMLAFGHLAPYVAIVIYIRYVHLDLEILVDIDRYLCSHTYSKNL